MALMTLMLRTVVMALVLVENTGIASRSSRTVSFVWYGLFLFLFVYLFLCLFPCLSICLSFGLFLFLFDVGVTIKIQFKMLVLTSVIRMWLDLQRRDRLFFILNKVLR